MAAGLWAHQRQAAEAGAAALAGGGRTTLIKPCGTGKTRTAGVIAARLASSGRVLAAVPTLELAAQTIRAWHDYGDGPLGTVTIACSDQEVLSSRYIDLRGVMVTTRPDQLAAHSARPGRVTMLTTYSSLPAVAAAHSLHDLPKWDLA
ncbi:DEAD/DEAH box helicase family protein [Nonomuraea jabiensis]|uniref:DEAD/DEAH box helicase family protein n=1 Tax=Nonomuraea jabiensis TaxID=882448 RepID=UPI003677DE65